MERQVLSRGIGRFGFFALAFGSMIGVGWVTALGTWLQAAGPLGAVLGFVAGGALMVCIGLCYAELCGMLPVAGGEVAYAYRAFGTGKAYLVGWFLAFGYLSVSAFEAISVARVAAYLLPDLQHWPLYRIGGETVHATDLGLAFAGTAAITWVNYRGARSAARTQNVLTLAFVAVTLVFVAAGWFGGSDLHARPRFAAEDRSGVLLGIAAVFVTAPFWFVGFDTIPQAAEEATTSVRPRLLALLIPASIAGATLFYCALIWSVARTGDWQQTAAADLPAAAAFEKAFGTPLLADLVLLAALLGLFTSWNGFFLAGSRVLFALGRGRIGPHALGAAHPRHGTPAVAVLAACAFTLGGACLGRGAMVAFIDVGSFCIAAAFLGVSLSAARLRTVAADLPRPYRFPGGLTLPRIAGAGALLILAVMLLPGTGATLAWPLEWAILAGVAAGAAIAWRLGARQRNAIDEVRRARLVLGDYAEPPAAR